MDQELIGVILNYVVNTPWGVLPDNSTVIAVSMTCRTIRRSNFWKKYLYITNIPEYLNAPKYVENFPSEIILDLAQVCESLFPKWILSKVDKTVYNSYMSLMANYVHYYKNKPIKLITHNNYMLKSLLDVNPVRTIFIKDCPDTCTWLQECIDSGKLEIDDIEILPDMYYSKKIILKKLNLF